MLVSRCHITVWINNIGSVCFSLSLFNILFHLVQSIIECIEAASLTFKYTFLPFPWPLSLYLPLTFVSPFLSRSTGLCGSLFITFALINGTACSINLMSLKLSHQTSSLCGCFHVVLTSTFSVCHPHKSIHFPKMKTKWEKKRNYYLFGVCSPLSIISRLALSFLHSCLLAYSFNIISFRVFHFCAETTGMK